MSFSRRIRNIAITQISAIKDRLDRIDSESDHQDFNTANIERNSRQELDDPFGEEPKLRTPEEIAHGQMPAAHAKPTASAGGKPDPPKVMEVNPLTHHYRVLGVDDGSDFMVVQNAYSRLSTRCDPERFEKGTEEHDTVLEIKKRVDASYEALRDSLDPSVGRFDKLEF